MLYADMVPWVMARANGLPEWEAIEAMRNACIEFCQQTYVLTTGSEVTIDGTELPVIDLTLGVVAIVEARIDGDEILVTYTNDPAVDELEDGEYALQYTNPNNAELTPPATLASPVTISMLLAIAPGPTSTEVDDYLWQRYSEALKSGALYRVLADPGRPWANERAAGYHKTKFEQAIDMAAATTSVNRRQTANRLRVRPT